MKRILGIVCILIIGVIVLNFYFENTVAKKYNIDENFYEQIKNSKDDYVVYKDIPDDLVNAIVSAEDKRFFEHSGHDIYAMARAAWVNIKSLGVVQGGSTLTQQLAKNLFFTNERNLQRKFEEYFLASRLESLFTKEQLFEMYINVVYFGSGAYGIQEASQIYFNKNVSELGLGECAMLAGLPKAPSVYAPNKNLDEALARQNYVLDRMEENGYIDDTTKNLVLLQEVTIYN